ncbi:MAG TPA: efflux RND transporter periplasmic adaptor subunit [Fibrobacteria bacterium]|nr:efflux RND transporter periplasmic adaptor subunit [Fibrobacteria bacterium]HOX50046.1 efflux RND transporter periplasmic adaptor subunit [Fibrobacteria bacterium]
MSISSRLLLLGSVSCLLVVSACKKKPEEPKGAPGKERVAKFAATLVVSAPFGDSTAGLAEVKARDRVDLRTEASGRIREIGFREGSEVRAGQVVVRLEDAEARATRDRAAAKLRLSVATLRRVREQVNAQSASQQQLETSLADSAVCQADLALAEATLAKMEVRAPFAGTVGLREVSKGQWVTSGQLLTSLVGSGDVRLEWALPEGLAFRLATGMTLSWRDPGTARGGRAQVEALAPELDESTRTRRLLAACRTGCAGLVPGATVEVTLPSEPGPVLSIPSQVLSGGVKGTGVFLARDGKAVFVPVVAGRRNAERIEIVSGLRAGDTVLVPGAQPPKPGASVEIARMLSEGGKPAKTDSARSAKP